MINIKKTDVVYICGQRGTGKSFMLEYIATKMSRFVIYDGALHQHGEMGKVVNSVRDFTNALDNNTPRIVIQPLYDSKDFFNECCGLIFRKGNYTLFVEELGNYVDNFSAPENFDILIRLGRNRGIGIVGANQRPARVWNNFVALIDHWIIFSASLPRDVDFLCEYIGKENEQIIRTMADRYFIYHTKNQTILSNPI